MTELVGAVLLDTRSIQKYVFYSNKLKTNIGASYLVENVFTDAAVLAIEECGFANPVTEWQDSCELAMVKEKSVDCEIANIGGGNMLILVRAENIQEKCRELVRKWSEKVLLMAPGLKTGAAVGYLSLSSDNEEFKKSLDELYKQLKENQNNIMPVTDLPYTGLTLECDFCGKTADAQDSIDGLPRMIAAEVKAKIKAYKYASDNLRRQYGDILGNEYEFCNEFENLGYKEGESYISVIHIDGNNMGVKFSMCSSLQERKALSLKIAQAVQKAFRRMLTGVVKEYEDGKYNDYLETKKLYDKKTGVKYLPLRPIIIGGDDVTFVCPARLGIEYARRFIKYANEEMVFDINFKTDAVMKKTLSCCGGVAIVPAKYPFFRAYDLAEQLCAAAKKKSRQNDDCLIDYAILHGELSSSLAWIRKNQYQADCGSLYFGPYDVVNAGSAKYIGKLYELQQILQKTLAANKFKELRSVLHETEHAQTIFIENTSEMYDVIKKQSGKTEVKAKDLWVNNKDEKNIKETPYIDAIEITDFVIPGIGMED